MSWDDIWKEKKYITDFSLRWLDFLAEKSSKLPENAKILEAGCGSGEGLAVLRGKKRETIGIDLSEEALNKARSYQGVMGIKGDNLALPFGDNTFDLVFNSGVIEHYKYPLNVKQLKEMARVTKPKGEVIVSVPNSLCLWYEAVKTLLTFFDKWPFGYEEGYTPWRLERSVREAGLEPTSLTGFLCAPPLATHNREILPFDLRKKIALFEKHLPFKEFYCYSVCVSCRKP